MTASSLPVVCSALLLCAVSTGPVYGQSAEAPASMAASAAEGPVQQQDAGATQMRMPMPGSDEGWMLMQDGALFAMFNHQGGPRGADEFKVPNWWMGMASRQVGRSRLTFNAMLSLDPATVGRSGYAEIFQVGEALDGRPLVDRQHPHDLFMQLAAVWRLPIGERTGFTLAGGPAGEPALGPVAFMHRASAADNPFAALSHHTFDSTHIAYGVMTAAVDRGAWVVEGSIFNGREPDENRWDFDFGRLDSVSARVWYRPADAWEFQASTGHLIHPEALEPGNIQRTTASGSWFRAVGGDFTAVTAGYGANVTATATRHAAFIEAARQHGRFALFGRAEIVQAETALLIADHGAGSHAIGPSNAPVRAFTIGAVRDLGVTSLWRGFEGGVGAATTFYGVPDALEPSHGSHPISFQIFFRLRPPAGRMGRMWNMRMSQPMAGRAMPHHGMDGMGSEH